MASNVNALTNTLSYTGVHAQTPPNLWLRNRAPTTGDVIGYAIGDIWLNEKTSTTFMLVSVAKTAAAGHYQQAQWVSITAVGSIFTLTGNAGGPQSPIAGNFNVLTSNTTGLTFTTVAGNLLLSTVNNSPMMQFLTGNDAVVVGASAGFNTNIVGAAGQIVVNGNAATNTLTISLAGGGGGGAIETIHPDAGANVAPVANLVNIAGTANQITTNGAGNTLTLALTNDVTLVASLTTGTNITAGGLVSATGVIHSDTALTTGGEIVAGTSITGGSFLALPNSTTPNGSILLNNVPYFNNYGSNLFIGTCGNFTLTGTGNIGVAASAVGNSLSVLTTGIKNISFGDNNLNALTTGSNNGAFGIGQGFAITTGSRNLMLLSAAGIVSGTDNILIRGGDLYTGAESYNLILYNEGVIADQSTIRIGTWGGAGVGQNQCYIAGAVFCDSLNNSLFGGRQGAIAYLVTSSNNSAVGSSALLNLAGGFGGNSCLGSGAGANLNTGAHNILIGYFAGSNYLGVESENICIDSLGTTGESNVIRLGATGVQTKCYIEGIAGVTTVVADAVPVLISASTGQLGTVSSSKRFKNSIKDMGDYSSPIMQLRPTTFQYNEQKTPVKSVGLIAEEVDELMPSLVVYDGKGMPSTVKYHDLVPMLLNEVQKLSRRITELENKS